MYFEPNNFVENLSYMGKGMLGIFIAVVIIIVVTYIINRIDKNKHE